MDTGISFTMELKRINTGTIEIPAATSHMYRTLSWLMATLNRLQQLLTGKFYKAGSANDNAQEKELSDRGGARVYAKA